MKRSDSCHIPWLQCSHNRNALRTKVNVWYNSQAAADFDVGNKSAAQKETMITSIAWVPVGVPTGKSRRAEVPDEDLDTAFMLAGLEGESDSLVREGCVVLGRK